MPTAYSYLRFSTPEQRKGDSRRRQTDMATKYAAEHGLDLDDKLTYRDEGVSAWRGRNAVDGALARFMLASKTGIIPAGSYLLVENLDRISRSFTIDALQLVQDIVRHGVTLITLGDGQAYTRDRLRHEPTCLMVMLVTFMRAHDESALKARRVRAAWQAKRDRASVDQPMTAKAPAWLRVKDKRFEVIPERVDLVRRVFAMAQSGMGKSVIARTLNAEGIAPWGGANGWHPSYVHKLLHNEAVIGRFQPMSRPHNDDEKQARAPSGPPIEGYFPPVLDDPGDFYRVRRGVSGYRNHDPVNALSGLARCAACGGSLHRINKGEGSKGGVYLACDNARRLRSCNARSVRYDIVIEALLLAMEDGEINLRGLLAGEASERQQELQRDLEAMDGRIAEAEAGIARLLDVLTRMPASRATEARLAETEATLDGFRARKVELERDARLATSEASGDGAAGDVLDVVADARAGAAGTVTRLNAALARLLVGVSIGHGTWAKDWLEAGVRWADARAGGTLPGMVAGEYARIMKQATVSIVVEFRATGRHLVISTDRRTPGVFVAGAAREQDGNIEAFTLVVGTDATLTMQQAS